MPFQEEKHPHDRFGSGFALSFFLSLPYHFICAIGCRCTHKTLHLCPQIVGSIWERLQNSSRFENKFIMRPKYHYLDSEKLYIRKWAYAYWTMRKPSGKYLFLIWCAKVGQAPKKQVEPRKVLSTFLTIFSKAHISRGDVNSMMSPGIPFLL